jgi:hypothetical protein
MIKGIHNSTTGSKATGKKAIRNSRTDMHGRMRLTRTDTTRHTVLRIDTTTREVNNDQSEEDMCSNPMDMDTQVMPMLVETTEILVCRIGSTILGISNDQIEAGTYPRTALDRKDHHRCQTNLTATEQGLKDNHHRQTRTTEVNRLSLEDMTRGTAPLSNGQATKVNLQSGFIRIRGMVSGSRGTSEIGQRNSHHRRIRMVDLVRDSRRRRNQRRVQWRSGKRKRRRECTRLPTDQR